MEGKTIVETNKNEVLTDKVYKVLMHYKKEDEPVDEIMRKKYERIVSADPGRIEKIFNSTKDFLEAVELYQKHNTKTAEEFGLNKDFQLDANEIPKENLEKFFQSLICQKNVTRENILKIEAVSHQHAMLLTLDGLQTLKDQGINDVGDRFKTSLDLGGEIFLSKIHGVLMKLEAQARTTGQGLKNFLMSSWSSIGEEAKKTEE
jgi:hypothetical protein